MVKFTGGGGSPIETRNALLDAPPSCYQMAMPLLLLLLFFIFYRPNSECDGGLPEILVGEGKQELGLADELPSF